MTPAGYQHIEFLRRFRLVAYALVMISIVGFCSAEGNSAVLVLGLIGCGLSWWLVESPNATPLPRWLINMGVLFASFLLFWELVILQEENLLRGLGHFMIAILICKLFETKQNRDYAQILTLSLLIMVAGAIFSQSLSFGLLLAFYLALGLYAILIFHLRFDTERALAGGSAPAELIMSAENQHRLRYDMRRMAFRVGLILVVFASGIFILFPRQRGAELFGGSWLTGRNQQTGFTEHIRFHEFTRMLESDTPAMEVRVDIDGQPYSFEREEPYFRGVTYDTYDLGTRGWRQPSITGTTTFSSIDMPPDDLSNAFHQRYRLLVGTSGVLFTLAGEPAGYRAIPALPPSHAAVVSDSGERRRTIYSPREMSLRLDAHQSAYSLTLPFEYEVTTLRQPTAPTATDTFIDHKTEFLGPANPVSDTDTGAGPVPKDEFHDRLERVLQDVLAQAYAEAQRTGGRGGRSLLAPAERLERARHGNVVETRTRLIAELEISRKAASQPDAGQIGQQIAEAREEMAALRPLSPDEIEMLVQDIVDYLRDNYRYSLNIRNLPGNDPILDFLENRKGKDAGHCEYFASAMVLLCRTAGLNARMVTGYHGGEYNALGGYLLVRQKHAHAWAEVAIPTRGWIMFDSSPPGADITPGWGSAWLKSIREFLQMIQSNWLNRIAGFDANTRKYIFDTLAQWSRDAGEWLRSTSNDMLSGIKEMLFSRQTNWQARIAVVIGILWCTIAGTWLIRQWHRRRTSHVAQIVRQVDPRIQRQLEVELGFFDDLLRALSRAGEPKPIELTPREYVESLAGRLGAARKDALWLVDLFYSIRFGLTHLTPTLEAGISRSLSTVRQQMVSRPDSATAPLTPVAAG